VSQFPIIPAFTPTAAPKPVQTPDSAQDIFADLLKGSEQANTQQSANAAQSDVTKVTESVKTAVDDAVDAASDVVAEIEPEADNAETGEALAAVVDALKQIQAAMQSGQTPDAEMLGALSGAIDKLAGLLGVSLDDMATPDQLLALTNQIPLEGEPAQSQLQRALAGFAIDLSGQTDSPDVAALGDKLSALISALGDVDPNLASTVEPEIAAAVARLPLSAGAARQEASAQLSGVTPPAVPEKLADVPVKVSEPSLDVKAIAGQDEQSAKPSVDGKIDVASVAPKDGKTDPAQVGIDKVVADAQAATQPTVQQAKTDTTLAVARPLVAGYQTSQQQINLPQIAFEMARQVTDGHTRFQMRLDPAELGRIDVRLDIDQSGQVTARLMVEKSETLDLMQRDQRALEKALQQAGLDGAKTNLEFSLKQNGSGQGSEGRDTGGRGDLFGQGGTDADTADIPTVNLYRGNLSASGVNILA